MVYFRTIDISDTEDDKIEKAIRHFSSKRHTSLDFKSTFSYVLDENNYFLGLETEKHIKVTRLRTPFERVFPTLILRFDKQNFGTYQIRYSLMSTFIFVLLSVAIVMNIVGSITSGQLKSHVIPLVFLGTVFHLLTLIELKLVSRKVNKAINRNGIPEVAD